MKTFTMAGVLALTGCASDGVGSKALEMIGLKSPPPPAVEMPAPSAGELPTLSGQMPRLPTERRVALRIHAGEILNTAPGGRSLAVVVRVYGLRGTSSFTQATYAMFANGTDGRPFANEDVVSSKEIVLVPGQKYEMLEPLARDATHLAVVALFRAPDAQRWRFVFEARSAQRTGVTLGVHGCAMSVSVGEPVGAQVDALRLAGVQCR